MLEIFVFSCTTWLTTVPVTNSLSGLVYAINSCLFMKISLHHKKCNSAAAIESPGAVSTWGGGA